MADLILTSRIPVKHVPMRLAPGYYHISLSARFQTPGLHPAALCISVGGPEGGQVLLRLAPGKARWTWAEGILCLFHEVEEVGLFARPLGPTISPIEIQNLKIAPLGEFAKLRRSLAAFAGQARFQIKPYMRLIHTAFSDMPKLRSALSGAALGNNPISPPDDQMLYAKWRLFHEPIVPPFRRVRKGEEAPLFSLLVRCKGPERSSPFYASIERQSKDLFELITFGEGGQCTNYGQAVQSALGEYVLYLEEDSGLFAENALESLRSYLQDEKARPDMLYADDDQISENGARHSPRFLCDWNPELFAAGLTPGPCCAVKREIAPGHAKGRQDFLLRSLASARGGVHLPQVLFHAYRPQEPPSEKGAALFQEHYDKAGKSAAVRPGPHGYKVYFRIKKQPSVSILIPNRDLSRELMRCVTSLTANTHYDDFEILILENNSVQPLTQAIYAELCLDKRVRVLTWDKPFHYSAINNFGAQHARGEYLLLLNNDTEALTPNWLSQLVGWATEGGHQNARVGAVGPKLLYPNSYIQHAGVVLGYQGVAGHPFQNLLREEGGYLGRADLPSRVSAVTGACMLTPSALYHELGGLDERFPIAFNDVDYCLRIRERGCIVLYAPTVTLTHHESLSRGQDQTLKQLKRHQREVADFWALWGPQLAKGDPYYSPHLTLHGPAYRIAPHRTAAPT